MFGLSFYELRGRIIEINAVQHCQIIQQLERWLDRV